MIDLTVFNNVKYVIDNKGNKAAVQVDINLWEALMSEFDFSHGEGGFFISAW
jgi:hypothetical protein